MLLMNPAQEERKHGRVDCHVEARQAEYLAEEEGVRQSEAGRGRQAANLLVKKERRQQVRRKAGC